MRRGQCSRGFTLIELLVVVAIIALLISILLPSLRAAREQGKQTKCVANLRSIGLAMLQYGGEHNDWFPFERHSNFPPTGPLHGFYYGGHPGHATWWGFSNPSRRDTPRGRAFNPYIFQNLPDYDVPADDPQFEPVRMLLAGVFGCPSDVGGFWNTQTGEDENTPNPLVYDTGNSYDENYHFSWRWALRVFPPGSNPTIERLRWLNRSNKFLAIQRRQHASRFIIAYEDPFDSSLWEGIMRIGWHRQLSRHSVLFLDSHAANLRMDPSGINSTSGPPRNQYAGWKTSSGFWWLNPDDPDYEYRDLVP
jgi:prepilin-type N-terminal cleavage/methylation domain-containing protein